MKSLFIIAGILFSTSISSVRETFFKDNSEKANTELYNLTKTGTLNSNPVLFAYNGLAIMRKAEYSFNPYSKLSFFKKGKNKIEKAIKLKPNNPELRFIRLSVQVNIPSFLGYNDEIKSDKNRVMSALQSKTFGSDIRFNKKVIEFLSNQNLISASEKKALIDLY